MTFILPHESLPCKDNPFFRDYYCFYVFSYLVVCLKCLYIPKIYMFDAFIEGDTLGCFQGGKGCGRQVLHLIAWEEPAEMERCMAQTMSHQPLTHLPNHIHIVVNGGNEEVGQFYPHASLLHGEDGVEHWGEMPSTDSLVDLIAERFQVYVGRIEIRQQVGKWFLTNVTCCYEDVPESLLMGQTGSLRHIFYIGKGLRIGIGDAWTVMLQAKTNHLFWRQIIMAHLGRCNLRDVMILTVQATEVTTRTSQGQTGRPWMEMIQRLLLDGVDGEGAGLGIDFADKHA
jgi:hypothetical protein